MELTPDSVTTLINLWKAAVTSRAIVSSPASLVLALGLDNQTQLTELREDPRFHSILERAFTWMCADWYAQLRLPAKEVNGNAVIFALRSMGYTDNPKAIKVKDAFKIEMHAGHDRI